MKNNQNSREKSSELKRKTQNSRKNSRKKLRFSAYSYVCHEENMAKNKPDIYCTHSTYVYTQYIYRQPAKKKWIGGQTCWRSAGECYPTVSPHPLGWKTLHSAFDTACKCFSASLGCSKQNHPLWGWKRNVLLYIHPVWLIRDQAIRNSTGFLGNLRDKISCPVLEIFS